MVVLESSFLIDMLRGEKRAVDMFHELEKKESAFFVAAPTVMELWAGTLRSKLPEKEKAGINMLLDTISGLPLDVKGAKRAAEIAFDLSKAGISIQNADIMIAGLVMEKGETLVTNDSDYTRIPGLKVMKYR